MFIDDYSHIHLVGAGGIGVSAIGKFLRARGKAVTGSDAKASNITAQLEALGIHISIGHDAANLPDACDLLVYTEAAGESNPERAEAARRGIRQMQHFDFLGELSKEYRTICVAGTNGKSTTTAMLSKILEVAGKDPTAFVGSLVPGWEHGNLRMGQSDILVIEGDEYKQKVVKLFPETTVITNIEEDHLEVYRDLDHIVATFQEVADKTKGEVLLNADDANSMRIHSNRVHYFAFEDGSASFRAEDRVVEPGRQSFMVGGHGKIELMIPGAFNMMNALAAASVAIRYGVPFEKIQEALGDFGGIWRRFERVGLFNGAGIISDYAHHPTAIRGTLAAAREFFPGHRIVLLFEPHQHARVRELFEDFVSAFDGVDVLVLSEIYGAVGRMDGANAVSSLDILNAIEQRLPAGHPGVGPKFYTKNLDDAEAKLREVIEPGDVVIVMGAGDVDRVARNLVE